MAIDNDTVRHHVRRVLDTHAGVPDVLRRLTKAFRLLQAERRDPALAADMDLAAAELYLVARQAVAANAVSLVQMLTMVAEGAVQGDTRQRMSRYAPGATDDGRPIAVSQDLVGWGVAGALQGEADRTTHLPHSAPPPFRPAFGRAGPATTVAGQADRSNPS
jgi:hypothetical protein